MNTDALDKFEASQLARPYEWDDDDEPESVGSSESGSAETGAPEQEASHRAGKRPRKSYGGKYPASQHYAKRATLDRDDHGTDLARFFRGVPHKEQVAICRAYASYLTAQNRGQAAAEKKTNSP